MRINFIVLLLGGILCSGLSSCSGIKELKEDLSALDDRIEALEARMETFNVDATLGNIDVKWYQMYCCLQRANEALKTLNTFREDEVSELEIKKAEMRVLRAYFYFDLSRLYNRIPYFDENVPVDDYTKISNVEFSRDEILDKIATDLLNAAQVLPEKQSSVGRVNRYVAYALAAKVRLYQAYEQDPQTHKVVNINKSRLQEVVDLCSRLEGKYDLLDDFQQLDLIAYENGRESVFAVQYSMNDGSDGAGNINWSNLLIAPKGPYNGDGFFVPSQNLVNAYQTDDKGLPLFDSFNQTDYDKMENGVYTCKDTHVDPRLDFVVGRPGIRWKTYTVSRVRQAGCGTRAIMVSTCPSVSWCLRKRQICSKAGRGVHRD